MKSQPWWLDSNNRVSGIPGAIHSHVRSLISGGEGQQLEDQRMRQWLIGLTAKTAKNLDVAVSDYPTVFDQMISDIDRTSLSDDESQRDIALLLWCGTATLTIRGSKKAKIGKSLERTLARALLTSIGLREDKGDFRLNVGADGEVDRETDAEVRTPRGFLRMEIGLIGEGNSEVIGDKVGRMNREVRKHLHELGVSVQDKVITHSEVEDRVLAMPLTAFAREQK